MDIEEIQSNRAVDLLEENRKLKNLLRQWGRHLEGCGWVSPLINGEYKKQWIGGCTCGYKKAIGAILQ
jgi:hypothetical protein